MKNLFLLGYLGFVCLITNGYGQLQKNCRNEWKNYQKCLVTVNQNFNNIHDMTDLQWFQMETDVQNCFRAEGCKDPLVNGPYRNGRRACFNQQKNKMIQDLNGCLRRYIPQSDLPLAGIENGQYNRFITNMNGRGRDQSICPPQANKGRINTCIRQTVTNRAGKARQTGNQCQAKQAQCDPPMSLECYDNWQRFFKPTLNRCINDLRSSGRLGSYKQQYSICLRNRAPNVFVQNPYDDNNLKYFDYLPAYYTNVREICAKNRNFG